VGKEGQDEVVDGKNRLEARMGIDRMIEENSFELTYRGGGCGSDRITPRSIWQKGGKGGRGINGTKVSEGIPSHFLFRLKRKGHTH
jgi:hypothetical protein